MQNVDEDQDHDHSGRDYRSANANRAVPRRQACGKRELDAWKCGFAILADLRMERANPMTVWAEPGEGPVGHGSLVWFC
jgi:hypothetical protein